MDIHKRWTRLHMLHRKQSSEHDAPVLSTAYLLCSRSEGAHLTRPCQLVASRHRLRIQRENQMSFPLQ